MKKLGFTETPTVLLRIPNFPFIKTLFFNNNSSSVVAQLASNSLMVREEQIVTLKQQENREHIEIIKLNESYGWGKIRKVKKFGINIRYFHLGGVYLKDPLDYNGIIKKIFSQYHISFLQIVSAESNSWNRMLKRWKKASMNGFIFFDLNAGVFQNINIMFGIIDVF